jgi:hypothetical protein
MRLKVPFLVFFLTQRRKEKLGLLWPEAKKPFFIALLALLGELCGFA